MSDIDWVSPNVKLIYKLFNKAFVRSIMSRHPYINLLVISPESFNYMFIKENNDYRYKVKIYICADFLHPEYDYYIHPEDLGRQIVHRFDDLLNFFNETKKIKEGHYISVDPIFLNKEQCQQRLNESSEENIKMPIQVRRRLNNINNLIHLFLDKVYHGPKICDIYNNSNEFIGVISEAIVERMYNYFFTDLDDQGDEWGEIYYGILDYVDIAWSERLEKYYNENCNKKSLNEDLSEKLLNRINNFLKSNSLMTAISFFGFTVINKMLKKINLSKEDKINFIKDVIQEYDPLTVFDLNEDPIFYGRTEYNYKEIYYFRKTSVSVKVWDEDFNDEGEFSVSYEQLDDSSIYDIFEMLYEYHEEENKNNQ